jgi:GT2 family glycosyltransferase
LNNDTIVHPDFVTRLIEVAKSDSEIGVVGPKSYHYKEGDRNRLGCACGTINYRYGSFKHKAAGQIDVGQLDQTSDIGYITGACMLLSSKAIEKIGLMDKRFFFAGGEDIDLCIRATKNNIRIVFAPKAIIWHKGETRARMSMNENRMKLYGYYTIRNQFLLMTKHWQKARLILPMVCWILSFPRLLFAFLRYYHSFKMFKSFIKGTLDFVKGK